jgi:hypothetical protein
MIKDILIIRKNFNDIKFLTTQLLEIDEKHVCFYILKRNFNS